MNEPINVLASLNTNIREKNLYKVNKDVQSQRDLLFDVVRTNNVIKNQRVHRGFVNSPNFNYENQVGNYTQSVALNKIDKLRKVTQDGYVYTFDFETIGKSIFQNGETITEADKLNNKIFSATEFAISRQLYKDGKAVGDPTKVLNFTSSPDEEELTKYVNKALRLNNQDSTTLSSLVRIAGYSDEKNFMLNKKTGKYTPTGWINNAKINNKDVLRKGEFQLSNKMQYRVGSTQYKSELKNIYEQLNGILNDDKAILTSFNGNVFDIPVMMGLFQQAGIDISDDFKDKIVNNTLDTQQLFRNFIKQDIFNLETKNGVKESLTVESLIHAANSLGANIDTNLDSHVALTDTINENKILSTFLNKLFTASDRVKQDIKKGKIKSSSKSLYHANSAIRANDDDIFFIDSGYVNANTYNSTLMEPGHTYKISSYDINKKDLPKELKKKIKNFKNKKIIAMEDVYDGYTRTSYLVTNSQKDIQERLLSTGNVTVLDNSESSLKIAKRSTELAFKDKARQTKDNFFRINSDKGFSDFEMYMDMFGDYTNGNTSGSKTNLSEQIHAMSNPNGDRTVYDALNKIFNKNQDLVHERAFNLLNLYDDFNMNYKLYSSMIGAVHDAINDNDFITNNNLSKDAYAEQLLSRTKTSALASVRESLYTKALENISDDEALNYIIKNNDELSNIVNNIKNAELSKAKKTKKVFGKSEMDAIKRRAYKIHYGERFSKTSDIAKNNIFGMVEISGSVKDFDGIDILNPDGEYTRLQINDKNNFMKKLRNQVYKNVNAENRIPQVSENMRKVYLKSVVDDLSKRGLIGSDVVEQFNNTSNVQGMINLIGENVYSTKDKFNNIIKNNIANIDYSKMSEDEIKFARNYINNHNMKRIYTEGKGFTVMGKSAQDFFLGKFPNLYDDMVDYANKTIPNFITYSTTGTTIESNKAIMGDILKSNFGWSESNVKNFMDKVINSSDLSTFQYATSDKKTNGLSHHIVTQNGKGYLISTPYDKEAIVADRIARGLNVGEINNLAVMWEIPKVEDYAGIPIIKQGNSDISYKAITKDIKLKYVKDENGHLIPSFESNDTLDTVIDTLKWNYKDAKRLMEEGAYESASKKLKSSWKKINKNKTLSSVTTRFLPTKNGKYEIIKQVGLNRADYALPGMVDVSDLVYGVDALLESNSSLKESFYKNVSGADYIKKEIIGFKQQLRDKKPLGFEKKTFDNWNKTFQLWFADNISEIAKDILNNKAFLGDNTDLISVLKGIQETGRAGFFGKESGDANRGFFYINSPDNFVAGSRFSGVARPLVNQVMSAQNIYSEDMINLSKYNSTKFRNKKISSTIFDNISSKSDLYNNLGINIGHGYMTSQAVDYVNLSRKLGKGDIGYTLKTKFMNSDEFLTKINKLSEINDKGLEELLSDKTFSNAIEKAGVNKSILDKKYIQKIARNIATATNLHEDSSLISPFVSTVMAPRTVTSIDYDPSSTNFKIGDKIKPGDIVKSIDDKVEISDKNAGKIVGMRNGKLFIQLNDDYFNMKGGFGSEKTQMISPFFENYNEMATIDAIIKHMSGGASAITNPSLYKHESFNSIMSGYANAIGYGIKTKKDLSNVNKSLKKFIPNLDMKYQKIDGRYVLIEGEKRGAVAFEDFQNFINDISTNGNEVMINNINDVRRNNIAYIDFVNMQDNTIQGSQGAENIGKGAAINYRSQSVIGSFIGDGNLDELNKYRRLSNGKIANLWDNLIASDVEQLANDPKFVMAQEQVQNIRVALMHSIGESVDNVNIQKFDLANGSVGSSIMQATELPNIFKYNPSQNRIHAYEIDLKDLNVDIENFIYKEIFGDDNKYMNYDVKDLERIRKTILPNVSKIYIPALNANYMDEGYTLTMTQRKAADLINSLNDFKNARFDGQSIEYTSNLINAKYKEYVDALVYDLVGGEGLNKRSLKIKSKYSARMKVSNVAAPIFESDDILKYKDLNFRDTSTVDGKYYGSVFVSKKDFLNQGVKFEDIGRQLIDDNIDDSLESLEIIRNRTKNKVPDIIKAKNLEQAREILKGHEINKRTYKKMGIDFLQQVGVYGVVMRDPAMKPTSYQPVKIRMRNLTSNTIAMDAVTADLINADVDGDEVNLFFKSLFSNGNVTKIKNINDAEVSSIKNIMEVYSDHNIAHFYDLAKQKAEKEFTGLSIVDYINEMKEMGRDIKDVDYFNNDTRFPGFLSRFTKATIGQISNPNYYLKAAATSFYADKPYNLDSYKGLSSILNLTDMAEQNLIDFKSIKTSEHSQKIALLASNYRQAIDDMALVNNKDARHNAINTLYTSLMPLASDKGKIKLGYDLSSVHGEMEQQISDAIDRILNNKVIKSTDGSSFTLEEAIYNIKNVLDDPNSRSLFFSQSIRQSDLSKVEGKEILSLDRIKRALYQKFDNNNMLMSLINGDNYLNNIPFLKGKAVTVGDMLYSLTDNGTVDEGVFKVTNVTRDGLNNYINLLNTNTRDIIKVNGNSFSSISKKISNMNFYDGEGFLEKLTSKYTDEVSSSLKSFNKINNTVLYNSESTFKFKAASSALSNYNIDNLTDMLGTIQVLKNKGVVSEDDATLFIKSMNSAIKDKGNLDYRKTKAEKLFNLKSFKKNTKISSMSGVSSFLEKEITSESIDDVMKSSKIASINDTINSLSRYNVDETANSINNIIDNTIKENADYINLNQEEVKNLKSKYFTHAMELISDSDKNNIRELNKIFSENTNDLDFITNVLGLKLDEIDELIKNNSTTDAIDVINSSKIAFGEYVGFNIGELEDSSLNKILSADYETNGISSEVVRRTKEIISKTQTLKEKGYVRHVSVKTNSNINTNTIVEEMINDINENIKNPDYVGKSNNIKGKSILDKISETASKMKGNKKLLYGALATAGVALAGSYIYGNSKLNEKDKQYVGKNTNNYNNPNAVKTIEQNNNSRSNYEQVPSSNMGYYASNGVSLNVKAKSPIGANGNTLNSTLSRIFGGAGVSVNTSMTDNRRDIDDRDVEEIMSKATRY